MLKRVGKRHWIRKMVFLTAVFAVGFFAGNTAYDEEPQEIMVEPTAALLDADKMLAGEDYMLTVSHVWEVIKPASDLITTKYYYTDANVYENYKKLFGKRVPFTTDQVVFTYEGKLSIGICLSDIGIELDNEQKIIYIMMPEIQILSNEIDTSSFEYPYVSDSVFNLTKMEDYTTFINQLKQEKEYKVMGNVQIIEEARANAEHILGNLLMASDSTKAYRVVFR